MRTIVRSRLVAATGIVASLACYETSNEGVRPPGAKCRLAMTLGTTAVTLERGASTTLSASVTKSGQCSDLAFHEYTPVWSAVNRNVAVLDSPDLEGRVNRDQVMVTGGQAGTTDIVVRVGSTLTVNIVEMFVSVSVVPVPVKNLTIAGAADSVAIGNPLQLTATVINRRDEVSTDFPVTWESSNQAFATVHPQEGVVTGVAKGPVAITARAGGVSATFAMRVVEPPAVAVSTIRIDSGLTTVKAAKTIDVTATAISGTGTALADRTIAWTSRAVSKAAVAPKGPNASPGGSNGTRTGVVSGDKVGKVWIIAEAEGKKDSIEVTVTPGDPDHVVVTPARTNLRLGLTRQITAEVRDIKENPLPNERVSWSSVQPTVATVNASTGVVTGVALGTAEVRATSGVASGSSTITVAPRRMAYGLADQPSAASYEAARWFNSAGGAITVTHTGPGTYRVNFPGQQAEPGETETILVSGYGPTNHICKLAGDWASGSGADLVANVNCFTYEGQPSDAGFTITLLGNDVLFGRFGFALTNQLRGAVSYTPPNSYNSGPLNPPPVSVRWVATGQYDVTFPGNGERLNDAEALHVTAVGPDATRCHIMKFVQETARVLCYRTGVGPVDTRLAITLLDRGRGGGLRAGFAWALDPDGLEIEEPLTFTLPSNLAYNSSTNPVQVSRLAQVGEYQVVFRGLAPAGTNSTLAVHVVDQDEDEPMMCNLTSWTIAGSDLIVNVQCYDNITGIPEDESFYVIVLQ